MGNRDKYIPALRFRFLTAAYDQIIKRLMPEIELKERLVQQANLVPGLRILDVGAGTGTLTLLAKRAAPGAEVIGVDGDPAILLRARSKARAGGLDVRFDEGLATALPYPDASFDRVLSSLMLHHLTSEQKLAALREMHRVLQPGGELHVLDIGRPHTVPARLAALVVRHLERAADNIDGLIPEMMKQAGFSGVAQTGQRGTIIGTLALYRGARKADSL